MSWPKGSRGSRYHSSTTASVRPPETAETLTGFTRFCVSGTKRDVNLTDDRQRRLVPPLLTCSRCRQEDSFNAMMSGRPKFSPRQRHLSSILGSRKAGNREHALTRSGRTRSALHSSLQDIDLFLASNIVQVGKVYLLAPELAMDDNRQLDEHPAGHRHQDPSAGPEGRGRREQCQDWASQASASSHQPPRAQKVGVGPAPTRLGLVTIARTDPKGRSGQVEIFQNRPKSPSLVSPFIQFSSLPLPARSNSKKVST